MAPYLISAKVRDETELDASVVKESASERGTSITYSKLSSIFSQQH